jgi:hypothetical protein
MEVALVLQKFSNGEQQDPQEIQKEGFSRGKVDSSYSPNIAPDKLDAP